MKLSVLYFSLLTCIVSALQPFHKKKLHLRSRLIYSERTSLEIECPASMVGRLIGPKGATINDMKSASGAEISIESTRGQVPAKVFVSGTKTQIEAAQLRIEAIIGGSQSAEMNCDKEHLPRLIGSGGSNIKKMSADSGTIINVDSSVTPVRIEIRGKTSAAVDKAVALVKTIIQPVCTANIPCGSGLSHVIGPGGQNMRDIEKTSGAMLLTLKDGVQISGSQEQVMKAKEIIQQIIADEMNPDYEGPEGKRLREVAQAHAETRSRLMREADTLFRNNDHDSGHAMMKDAKAAGETMHAANAAAAKAIIAHRNDGRGFYYLDLHGLLVDEAIQATEKRLDALQATSDKGDNRFEVITGSGRHSAQGSAKILPAIKNLLDERGLRFTMEQGGLITVHC